MHFVEQFKRRSALRCQIAIVKKVANKLKCDEYRIVPFASYTSAVLRRFIGVNQRAFAIDLQALRFLRELLRRALQRHELSLPAAKSISTPCVPRFVPEVQPVEKISLRNRLLLSLLLAVIVWVTVDRFQKHLQYVRLQP